MANSTKDNSHAKPPQLANHIMSLLLPKRFVANVIGDLEEEFYQLSRQDVQLANKWYWQQTTETSLLYLRKKMSSVKMLGRLNFYLPLALFLIVTGLIVVLSVLEEPEFISPTFWHELLQGKIHTALFSDNFWHNFWIILAMAEWTMFIHLESLFIATINIFVLIYIDKRQKASIVKFATWGYALAFMPYIWSIFHIANNTFVANQIGPIIATGILSLWYMLLPVSFMIHRKLKRQQINVKKFEKNIIEQEHQQKLKR